LPEQRLESLHVASSEPLQQLHVPPIYPYRDTLPPVTFFYWTYADGRPAALPGRRDGVAGIALVTLAGRRGPGVAGDPDRSGAGFAGPTAAPRRNQKY